MLNAVTVEDSYPLPLIQDIFDQLEEAKLFSTLDLKSGYWQTPLAPEDCIRIATEACSNSNACCLDWPISQLYSNVQWTGYYMD